MCVYFTEIPFEKTGVLSSYFFMQIYFDAFFAYSIQLICILQAFQPLLVFIDIIYTDLLPTVVS